MRKALQVNMIELTGQQLVVVNIAPKVRAQGQERIGAKRSNYHHNDNLCSYFFILDRSGWDILAGLLLSHQFISLVLLIFLAKRTIAAHELSYYLDKYARDTIQSIHANFSLRLLSSAADEELNAVLSPLSLASAAASGITRVQINDVFARGFNNDAVQKYYSLLANRLLLRNNGTIIAPGLLVVLHLCDRAAVSNAMIDIARDYMADILQFDCKNNSTTVAVEMMSMWAFDKFKYTKDIDVQVLGLPYQLDSNLFFHIFLPREKFALKNIMSELTGRRLLFLIARCKTVDVEVEISRFSIENHFELNLPLASLRIVEAFTSRADFPAVSGQRMHVSTVIQKTQIEINEKGSYPVNNTHEMPNDELSVLWQGGHIKFIANHPFLFVITKIDQMILIGHYSSKFFT